MLDQVRHAPGEVFRPAKAYLDDSNQYWSRIDRFEKIERQQKFADPRYESWHLFTAGRWEESLAAFERVRPEIVAEFANDARLGYTSHRVRVVEYPITPYVQWEMNGFKIRVECGEDIRIVDPTAIGQYESDGDTVPELIFMGTLAMYEVLYDATGNLAGGRKFTDPRLIEGCLSDVRALHETGEDFWSFFEREVAPLPPPAIDSTVHKPAEQ